MQALQYLLDIKRASGGRACLIYMLDRLLRKLRLGDAVHYCLLAVDLAGVQGSQGDADPVSITQLKRGDERFEALDIDAQTVRDRLHSGARCLALIKDGTLCGAIWCTQKRHEESGVRARFLVPEQMVWDYGTFIAMPYRSGDSFERLWQGYAKWCLERRIGYSIGRIATHDLAALQRHETLPHSALGYCTFIRIFSRQFCLSPMHTKWHVSRSERDMPVFQVAL
ncbi:MAG: hypothetical protein AAF607_10395 [Pseudomonadota bacterium]